MRLDSLQDVFEEQLGDLYSAERQLVEALPKVAGAAWSDDLRDAIMHHLEETRQHVRRLDDVFQDLQMTPPMEECEAMKGLIREGEKVISTPGDGNAKDAAIIAAAQRVEHYEIAAYGTARALAQELDLDAAAGLLDETLDEESKANEKLNTIATGGLFKSGVNRAAAG
ncbi:MAG: YciE/YciF ferroxidase family protein [Gaiellales bacterium]